MSRSIPRRAALVAGGLLALATGHLSGQALDRTRRPTPAAQPPLKLPRIEMRALMNGVPVAVMQDHRLPLVSVRVLVDVHPANEPADKTGLGALTLTMLGEGTTRRTADEIADAATALGMSVEPTGFVTITANLDSALALLAEQLLHPAFPPTSLDRVKADVTAGIRQRKEHPGYLANAVFSRVLYGVQHPYSRQPTEESVAAITRDDVEGFYRKYFAPPNVRLVVVGDITPTAAVAKLNRYFGTWPAGASAKVDTPIPPGVQQTTIYLYDRPGSPQSVMALGTLGPRRDTPDYHAITVMNTVLGGAFSSRLNLNLREQHGYTYGVASRFEFRRVPEVSTFHVMTAVHAAKTDSALIETMRELRALRGDRQVTAEEFGFAKANSTKQLPLQFETVEQRARAVVEVLRDKLPLNYYEALGAKIAAVTRAQVQAAARAYLKPDQLAIVVVGDRKGIEAGLRAAHIAPVVVVDLNGKPVQ